MNLPAQDFDAREVGTGERVEDHDRLLAHLEIETADVEESGGEIVDGGLAEGESGLFGLGGLAFPVRGSDFLAGDG